MGAAVDIVVREPWQEWLETSNNCRVDFRAVARGPSGASSSRLKNGCHQASPQQRDESPKQRFLHNALVVNSLVGREIHPHCHRKASSHTDPPESTVSIPRPPFIQNGIADSGTPLIQHHHSSHFSTTAAHTVITTMPDYASVNQVDSDKEHVDIDQEEFEDEEEVTREEGNAMDNPDDDDNDDEEAAGYSRSPSSSLRRKPPATMDELWNNNPNGSNSNTILILWAVLMAILVAIAGYLYLFKDRIAAYEESERLNHTNMMSEQEDEGIWNSPHENNDSPTAVSESHTFQVHYDTLPHEWDPFDLQEHKDGGWADFQALPWLTTSTNTNNNNNNGDDNSPPGNAYLMQPHAVNGTLVFVAEGDLYLATHTNAIPRPSSIPALKLTTTVGNVRHPHLHPTLPMIAFTATYTGRREVYLMDLRQGASSWRVTYWDDAYGVSGLVGWKDDTTLLVAAPSLAVSLPDIRLFQLNLGNPGQQSSSNEDIATTTTPLEITPVPLSQALNGVYDGDCLYFTRFAQNSKTIRYVGGTAESLWIHCADQDLALPLTGDYNGTSKVPQLWTHSLNKNDPRYILFMSDRNTDSDGSSWHPTTMNLWALALPENSQDWYNEDDDDLQPVPIPLTIISCDFHGQSLQDFSVDSVTGDVYLRVGADIHLLRRDQIQHTLHQIQKDAHEPPVRVPLHVLSDFHELQERILTLNVPRHYKFVDAMQSPSGNPAALLTVRGQAWVSPTNNPADTTAPSVSFQGGGQVLPERTYRLAPGTLTAGSMRVLVARSVPLPPSDENDTSNTQYAVILATDPQSPTAEHAFYLVESHAGAVNVFNDAHHLPEPFLGGGSQGGLGSVQAPDVTVSPCGRRLAWTDLDGRICVATLPLYNSTTPVEFTVLPKQNELGEPMLGKTGTLVWSPGGRYLAIQHLAANLFNILSIADLGDPSVGKIVLGRIVQASPSRFNARSPYWGISTADASIKSAQEKMSTILDKNIDAKIEGSDIPQATTLYFLTDRDVMIDNHSPWGQRGPFPHFTRENYMYALPLPLKGAHKIPIGRFSAGGAMEVVAERLAAIDQLAEKQLKEDDSEKKEDSSSDKGNDDKPAPQFPTDYEIDFGEQDLSFARKAFRIVEVPKENEYLRIAAQMPCGSFALMANGAEGLSMEIFSAGSYPEDGYDHTTIPTPLLIDIDVSTDRAFVSLVLVDGSIQVVPNVLAEVMAATKDSKMHKASSDDIAISIWPSLEYRQMFNDAWRMLRDYFWDPEMHQIDWNEIHNRYSPLVDRCVKREDLDDVLSQMAAELSALHVFVYGGEYNSPYDGDKDLLEKHAPASLGATLQRNVEWKGYEVTEIARRDPDYNLVEDQGVYSPLCDQTLRLSGQKGLKEGDIIVGVNGESAFRVPDIHMLLRGQAGRAVRLEVLRLASGDVSNEDAPTTATPEPVMVVPLSQAAAADLKYSAWEWKTREKAKALAKEAGFQVAYIHLRSMGEDDMDQFARLYFEDFDKEAMILDLRHNRGGNIDSWIVSFLQRKAWYFFSGRLGDQKGVDTKWNQQYAFRGHVVVLIDEKTSSDGEGVSRAISELGLGVLIGKRTWGGGIWLSSDNRLVDGGIATAPEDGVWNDKWGFGLGIEGQGIRPDIEVDNNPRASFDGKDAQLERAVKKLQHWLKEEPILDPQAPANKPDLSLKNEKCHA